MAISYVGVFAVTGNAASISVTWPTHQAGDLAILGIEVGGNQSLPATPTGFTAVSGSPVADVATIAGSKLYLYYRFATSALEPAVATGDSGDHQVAGMLVLRGVDQTTPFDATPVWSTKTTASTSVTYPDITTATANAWIALWATRANDSGTAVFTAPTNANLSSITERGDGGTTGGHGGGLAFATALKATAGATGTSSGSTGAISTTNVTVTVALRPATLNAYLLETTPGSYSVTGSSAGALFGAGVHTTPDSYALTGSDAQASFDAALVATTPGSYALTEASATTLRTALSATTPGSFTITGVSAELIYGIVTGFTLDTTPGSYAISGQPVSVLFGAIVTTTPGAYAQTGQSATTLRTSLLQTALGAYTVVGQSAQTQASLFSLTTPGAYSQAGASAQTLRSSLLATTPGAYSIAGQSADTSRTYAAAATPGAYLIDGQFVELIYSGDTPVVSGPTKAGGFISNMGTFMNR